MTLTKEIILYIVSSIIIGLSFNLGRSWVDGAGISLLAEELKIVSDSEQAFAILSDPRVSIIDLQSAIEFHEKEILFVDARAEEYLYEGVIPGAISNDDIEVLSDEISDLIGYNKGFVVYCSDDDCGSSEDLAYELQERGFMNIFVFKGGWKEWTDAKMTIEVKIDD